MQISCYTLMELKFYKLLSYILLLPHAFLALTTVMSIFAAFSNPGLFFVLIIFIAVLYYAINSFAFLQRGIVRNAMCSYKVKRAIRNSSIPAFLFCAMCLMNSITLLSNSTIVETVANAFIEQSKGSLPKQVTTQLLVSYINVAMYCLATYGALLLLHILMTYKFTKLYENVFEKNPNTF